jgi:hypothetical protein
MSGRSSETLSKSSRRGKKSNGSVGWQGFVDLPLTTQQKEHLAELSEDDYPDIGAFMLDVLADGYKLSVVTDEKHNCVIASLTGKSAGCVNAGYSLSARGPDLAGAFLVLHYKHHVLCEGLRWSDREGQQTNALSKWD